MRPILITILALSLIAGCDPAGGGPHPGTGPGDNRATAGNLGGEPVTAEDWRKAGAALIAAQGICGLFRAGNDTALTSGQTRVEMTNYASTPQVPAGLVNAVGEYYLGSLTPDTPDHATALTIRRGRVVAECERLRL